MLLDDFSENLGCHDVPWFLQDFSQLRPLPLSEYYSLPDLSVRFPITKRRFPSFMFHFFTKSLSCRSQQHIVVQSA
jgi:hypothetical protein